MPSTKSLLVGGAAAAMLAAAPPAGAAVSVYGGTTSAGEAIVLKADASGAALKSAVIGWRAKCSDGGYFPGYTELAATVAEPGFSPGYRDLLMSRNAKGRFAGTQVGGGGDATMAMAFTVDVTGKLGKARATGTLRGVVKAIDTATGASAFSCDTGLLRYSASRAPGAIYGGRTSQEQPVVVRVDPERRVISDLIATWRTSTCTPDASFSVPDGFRGLRLKSTGAFAAAYAPDYPLADGSGTRHFAYQLSGRVARTKLNGSLHVTFNDTDAAGVQTLACDTGGITFKAQTG
jgi:hypothetical protein